MKTALIGAFVVALTSSFAMAGDRAFVDFKAIVGDETLKGKFQNDTTCEVKTEWQDSGDLIVTGSYRYKNEKPRSHEIVFSTSNGVEYTIDHGDDDQSEYSVSQSKVLVENHDESVTLYESFTVNQDASGATYVSISVMEVNDHSDPHEIFVLYCSPN